MTGLTDEAKEQFGLLMQIRLRAASAAMWVAFKLMPQAYYDDLRRAEVERMADQLGMVALDFRDPDDTAEALSHNCIHLAQELQEGETSESEARFTLWVMGEECHENR